MVASSKLILLVFKTPDVKTLAFSSLTTRVATPLIMVEVRVAPSMLRRDVFIFPAFIFPASKFAILASSIAALAILALTIAPFL